MGWPYRFDEERKFGVELEVLGSSIVKELFNRLAIDEGLDVRRPGYTHMRTAYWKIVPDGSLGEEGFEVVSPPLQGMAGLREVEKVCDCLTRAGVTIDATCGLHVHHDAASLSGPELSKLLLLYAKYEPLIDGLVPPSRRGNQALYARSMRIAGYLNRAIEIHDQGQSKEHLASRVFSGRYWKINLDAWLRHGTVEFRQHSGTHEYTKVEAWVVLTQALINRAIISQKHDWEKPASWSYFTSAMFGRTQDQTPLVKRVKKFLMARRKHFKELGYDERRVISEDSD